MLNKILMAVVAGLILVNVFSISGLSKPPPDFAAQHQGKVILYATSWCGYCEKTRRLLEQNGIEYVEYDIEASKEGMSQYKALGGRGVPVLLIAGEVVSGYSPKRILQLSGEAG